MREMERIEFPSTRAAISWERRSALSKFIWVFRWSGQSSIGNHLNAHAKSKLRLDKHQSRIFWQVPVFEFIDIHVQHSGEIGSCVAKLADMRSNDFAQQRRLLPDKFYGFPQSITLGGKLNPQILSLPLI